MTYSPISEEMKVIPHNSSGEWMKKKEIGFEYVGNMVFTVLTNYLDKLGMTVCA
jgi:hypothetical protein